MSDNQPKSPSGARAKTLLRNLGDASSIKMIVRTRKKAAFAETPQAADVSSPDSSPPRSPSHLALHKAAPVEGARDAHSIAMALIAQARRENFRAPSDFGRIEIAGEILSVDPAGALYEPRSGALIVADLHLEKGSAFARRGQLLPPYDTAATLIRLAAVVERWQPKIIIALGDSFHDSDGPDRMNTQDGAALAKLQGGRDWIWISGNHDPVLPAHLSGERAKEMRLGELTLRHEPHAGGAYGEIAGHLHPVAIMGGRRRTYVTDGRRVLAPAFGAYTGGLNLHDPAIAKLFSGRRIAHVLGQDRVYAVCATRCARGR